MGGSAMSVNLMYIRSHIVIPLCDGFSQSNVETHCFITKHLLEYFGDASCPGERAQANQHAWQLYESKWAWWAQTLESMINLKNPSIAKHRINRSIHWGIMKVSSFHHHHPS